MSAKRYRKKPVVIEAVQWTGEYAHLWRLGLPEIEVTPGDAGAIGIRTLEGIMRAELGDWIIKGIAGEFYPCKPEIFAATYEEAP